MNGLKGFPRLRLLIFGLVIFSVACIIPQNVFAQSAKQQAGSLAPGIELAVSAKLGGVPSYDSGWVTLGPRSDAISIKFNHNLNTNTAGFLVDLTCRDNSSLAVYDCRDDNFHVDAHWYDLTTSSVRVYVVGGNRPDEIRLRIYQISYAYSSSWHSLGTRSDPIAVPFSFNIANGHRADYHVNLECWDSNSTLKHYDCTGNLFHVHAHWYALGDSSIKVYVRSGTSPTHVRVRIYRNKPSYDSGWYTIGTRPDKVAAVFNHHLGSSADAYYVNLECQDNTVLAVYDCTQQSFLGQSHWSALNPSSIRSMIAGGSQPDKVRVRIWLRYYIYLPSTQKNLQ